MVWLLSSVLSLCALTRDSLDTGKRGERMVFRFILYEPPLCRFSSTCLFS